MSEDITFTVNFEIDVDRIRDAIQKMLEDKPEEFIAGVTVD